ncbi:MAG: PEGA domain-containing protein [Proteobacteria bacterium]|nr:PEGA domain-containing protein [Pseudomonadota bacterium]
MRYWRHVSARPHTWARRGLSLALLLAALLAPGAAGAQDSATQQAKDHFDEGQNLYLQGDFLAAALRFRSAYEAKPFSAFLFNVAVCYEKNKDFQRALEFYERFLAAEPHSQDHKMVEARIGAIRSYLSPPVPVEAPSTDKASSATSQPTSQPVQPVQPALPTLPPVQPKGLVVIESAPEGAAIYLGDKKNGIFTRAPYTGSLPPGQQTLIIELKDFTTVRKTVSVRTDRLTYLYFALTPQRNLGWIEVKGNIPGASVFFDQRQFGAVGHTPYSGYLLPGRRKVVVAREGYADFERQVNVVAGQTHVVNFTLEPVRHGWLRVTGRTTRGAQIRVDGRLVTCSGTPCRAEITVGDHRVRLEREGFKAYETRISVSKAEEVQLAVRLNPEPSRTKAYVSFGMAAALLGVGVGAAIVSNKRKDGLEADIKGGALIDRSDRRFLEGRVAAVVADSLFALGGVVGVLGVYYLVRNEGPDSYGETETRRVALTPVLGPTFAGVTTEVRF